MNLNLNAAIDLLLSGVRFRGCLAFDLQTSSPIQNSSRSDRRDSPSFSKVVDQVNEPLVNTRPHGPTTLPGLLARMTKDEVDGFPALRAHQEPGWHMFLVQLGALAMHKAGLAELPESEAEWLELLRGLTRDFAGDEPWCLVVPDWQKPAFLQPPVPKDVTLANPVDTADALDRRITSRNHDLKQAVAAGGQMANAGQTACTVFGAGAGNAPPPHPPGVLPQGAGA
eukprot:gene15171-20098_t